MKLKHCQDVDFIINIDSAPASIKTKLLALPNSPFLEQAQFFFFKTPSGNHIQVDITPKWQVRSILLLFRDKVGRSQFSQSPYMPNAAKKVQDIPDGTVPHISVIDLIVFKINSCGLRAQDSKKRRDALDAEALLEKETRVSPLSLTKEQKRIVELCIPDVVAHGGQSEEWWRSRLDLPAAP